MGGAGYKAKDDKNECREGGVVKFRYFCNVKWENMGVKEWELGRKFPITGAEQRRSGALYWVPDWVAMV